NTNVRIRIACHADDRWSDGYNLALGNRRWAPAKRYLGRKGSGAARTVGACRAGWGAWKTDVQLVQGEVVLRKAEMARRDSARAAQLDEIIQVQRQIMDSLNSTRRSVAQVRGDLSTDLYNIQQQLVQLQELTGQSQPGLTHPRTRR